MGCRSRAAKSDLLRVVAAGDTIVVDRRGRLPGRGAHVHPDPQCVELAERRKAFSRALRRPGALDLAPLHEAVAHDSGAPAPEVTKGGRARMTLS